ncbi:hypothetical protein [Marinomonas balearica]|uniref:Capsular polysaccharide biosynthesis protein n=1 Tax=Marinomonas balearica TaxID=491947 RepID=A0A4R6M504_9GAMM|nr:hypothetical protein [Marinomonas balearica]TDO96314.1 hypothetical protein DFP79_2887 [Marinomonas balearica]
MSDTIIFSNDFDVSKYVLSDLDDVNHKVICESDLKYIKGKGTFAKITSLLSRTQYKKFDKIVVSFSIENIVTLDYIGVNFGKPIVWLWNPLSSMTVKNKFFFLQYIKKRNIEVWTFDRHDAVKYRFKFHNQIHSEKLISKELGGKGAFFSGVDKNRLPILMKIMSDLSCNNVETNFHIVRDRRKKYSPEFLDLTTDKYIDFKEYLKRANDCEVLVDVVQGSQGGFTLRVIEALFLNKKLITTDFRIKEYDFYHRNNVYVYGQEDRALSDFLEAPYQEVLSSLKERYTLTHFMNSVKPTFYT